MVEFALVLPLLLLLFVGIAEFGFVFKQKLLIDNAVQTATRTGSALGTNVGADMAVLDSIQQGFSGLPCPNPSSDTDESNIGGPWLPSTRNVDVGGTLDHIGVTIYYGHDWVIGGYGFLPDLPCNPDGSQCWTETSVFRLEPATS